LPTSARWDSEPYLVADPPCAGRTGSPLPAASELNWIAPAITFVVAAGVDGG